MWWTACLCGYYESVWHAGVTFPFQTGDQSSEDMDSLDGESIVDNADTNINVSTNLLTWLSLTNTLLCFHSITDLL